MLGFSGVHEGELTHLYVDPERRTGASAARCWSTRRRRARSGSSCGSSRRTRARAGSTSGTGSGSSSSRTAQGTWSASPTRGTSGRPADSGRPLDWRRHRNRGLAAGRRCAGSSRVRVLRGAGRGRPRRSAAPARRGGRVLRYLDRDVERAGRPVVVLLTRAWHERDAPILRGRYEAEERIPDGIEAYAIEGAPRGSSPISSGRTARSSWQRSSWERTAAWRSCHHRRLSTAPRSIVPGIAARAARRAVLLARRARARERARRDAASPGRAPAGAGRGLSARSRAAGSRSCPRRSR